MGPGRWLRPGLTDSLSLSPDPRLDSPRPGRLHLVTKLLELDPDTALAVVPTFVTTAYEERTPLDIAELIKDRDPGLAWHLVYDVAWTTTRQVDSRTRLDGVLMLGRLDQSQALGVARSILGVARYGNKERRRAAIIIIEQGAGSTAVLAIVTDKAHATCARSQWMSARSCRRPMKPGRAWRHRNCPARHYPGSGDATGWPACNVPPGSPLFRSGSQPDNVDCWFLVAPFGDSAMANDQLSIPERAALLALMTFVKETSNTDLDERYGFKIEKKVRDRLEEEEYITAHKIGPHRMFVHKLTDKGRHRCREEFAATLPARAPRAYRLLYGVLHSLDAYMSRSSLDMIDIFGTNKDQFTSQGVDASIRASYAAMAPQPGARVKLSRLRAALSEFPRKEVDDALLRLDLQPGVRLVGESDQQELTDEDREAAIRIGGQAKHLVSIERP